MCPEPLLDFKVRFLLFFHRTEEPYRPFWTALLKATDGLAEPQYFAFDWRKDVRESARRLAEQLGNLHGRDVVLMTHSWGSAVTWYFLVNHYDPAKQAKIRHIVFIAPSFCGVCEILRALQSGLPAMPEDQSKFASKLAKGLFGPELRRAFFTFPGAFEHLPVTGACGEGACSDEVLDDACLEVPEDLSEEHHQREPADFFSLRFWQSPVAMRTFLVEHKPWASDQEKRQFFVRLEGVLNTARSWRGEMTTPGAQQVLTKWKLPVTLFYSAEFATVRKAKIPEPFDPGDSKIPLNFVFQVPGDGRVPLDTVKRREFFANDPTNPALLREIRIIGSHGDLPNLSEFTKWMMGTSTNGDPGLPAILSAAAAAPVLEKANPATVDPKLRLFVQSLASSVIPAASGVVAAEQQLKLAEELLSDNELRPAIHALSDTVKAAKDSPDVLRQAKVRLVEAFAREGRCRDARDLNRKIGGEVSQELKACQEGRRQHKPKT